MSNNSKTVSELGQKILDYLNGEMGGLSTPVDLIVKHFKTDYKKEEIITAIDELLFIPRAYMPTGEVIQPIDVKEEQGSFKDTHVTLDNITLKVTHFTSQISKKGTYMNHKFSYKAQDGTNCQVWWCVAKDKQALYVDTLTTKKLPLGSWNERDVFELSGKFKMDEEKYTNGYIKRKFTAYDDDIRVLRKEQAEKVDAKQYI